MSWQHSFHWSINLHCFLLFPDFKHRMISAGIYIVHSICPPEDHFREFSWITNHFYDKLQRTWSRLMEKEIIPTLDMVNFPLHKPSDCQCRKTPGWSYCKSFNISAISDPGGHQEANTLSPLYLWVPHLQIRPTMVKMFWKTVFVPTSCGPIVWSLLSKQYSVNLFTEHFYYISY